MTGILPNLDTRVVERVTVAMRDGVRLGGVLYRASAAEPGPVLLVRTPYSEPLSRALPVQPALDAGFVVLVQDCRGTGRSEGEFRTFENERADGLDTLDWLRGQPWCAGKIVMFGQSYLGMVQLAGAGDRPAGLAAIATTVTPDDYRDGLAYRQGAFQLGQALAWHLMKAAQALGDAAARGTDVAAPMADLLALTRDTEAAYRALPLSDRPGIANVLPSWHTWLSEEDSPGYWRDISYAGRTPAVPGLHVGGWFDLFLRGTLNNFTATPGQHLIVGPWSHVDQTGVVGEVFYAGGAAQAIQLEQQQLRFLRESVDGVPTSLPPVRIYVMGADRWRVEQEWPLARTDWQTWYLGADGSLGHDVPAAGTAEFDHDPRDPVPTVGGAILMAGSRDGRTRRGVRVHDRPRRHQPGLPGRAPSPGGRRQLQLPVLRPQLGQWQTRRTGDRGRLRHRHAADLLRADAAQLHPAPRHSRVERGNINGERRHQPGLRRARRPADRRADVPRRARSRGAGRPARLRHRLDRRAPLLRLL